MVKTAGLSTRDVWFDRILRDSGVEVTHSENCQADVTVLIDSLHLAHHGEEHNYRPFLAMSGQLMGITVREELPYGINTITFDEAETVTAFYEFSDEQLVTLAQLGYFSTGFSVPEELTGIEWELPAHVDVHTAVPHAGDTPFVFATVHNMGDLTFSEYTSGYDLTEYFDNVREHGHEGVSSSRQQVRERHDQLDSLFADIEDNLLFKEDDEHATQAEQKPERAPDSLRAQFDQVARELDDEARAYHEQLANQEGTIENIYRDCVADSFHQFDQPNTSDEAVESMYGDTREKTQRQRRGTHATAEEAREFVKREHHEGETLDFSPFEHGETEPEV